LAVGKDGYTTGIDKADERLSGLPYTEWYYHDNDELMGLMREKLRKLNSITFVHLDDWVGVYVDGKCVYQNHSIRPEELLNLIEVPNKSCWIEDYDENLGELPENLDDLKL